MHGIKFEGQSTKIYKVQFFNASYLEDSVHIETHDEAQF